MNPISCRALALTPYQRIFLNEWLLNPSGSGYNLVLDQVLTGDPDIERLNRSVIRLVNECLLFNCNVSCADDQPVWVEREPIAESAPLLIYHPEELSEKQILAIVAAPFDLEKDLLLRFHAIRLKDGRTRIIYIIQHILIDGSSFRATLEETARLYNDPEHTLGISLPEQRTLHHELSLRLEKVLSDNRAIAESFWRKRLAGLDGEDFGFLRNSSPPRAEPGAGKSRVGEFRFHFKAGTLARLKQLRRPYRITPYVFGQIVFGILLHRFSGKPNVGVSFPIAIPEGKELIYGAHINNLIIDFRFDRETTVLDLIQSALGYYEELKSCGARYVPVYDIVGDSHLGSLLDASFVQTDLKDVPMPYEGIEKVEILRQLNIDLPNKLLFEQELESERLNYRVRFDADCLDEALVRSFIGCYRTLFEEVLESLLAIGSETRISEYRLMGLPQYNRTVRRWNATEAPWPAHQTVHALFEEQVQRTPDQPALVCAGTRLTYSQLNERANQLAALLREMHGVAPGHLVGLCLDRSEWMLIGILGILKAGAAYVPLDPAYPDGRIGFILQDTNAAVVLSDEMHRQRLAAIVGSREILVESLNSTEMALELGRQAPANLDSAVRPEDLFYIVYTSGTTGRPKGVMIEHRHVTPILEAVREAYDFRNAASVTAFTSVGFDVSSTEFFVTLLNGGELHLLSEPLRADVDSLSQYLLEHEIEYVYLPPALLAALPRREYPKLKTLVYAGEPCEPETGAYWGSKKRLFNYYGPTETNIATGKLIQEGEVHLIGRPVRNAKVYVLDKAMKPLSPGAVGEIHIGGCGVARGYLNSPELTAERFLANPFQTAEDAGAGRNERLYKTGDLGRLLPDGNIEFIGRNDFQIKIRGYRVELGEIEAALMEYSEMKQAVVLIRENGSDSKILVAYCVAAKTIEQKLLFAHLAQRLPAYMMPSVLLQIDRIPVTVNGKIDRAALPAVEADLTRVVARPENQIQEKLRAVFAKVLGLREEEVGIDDDFFALGGNSILAIKLVHQINQNLAVNLRVAAVLENRTIRQISAQLPLGAPALRISPRSVDGSEGYRLSFAQERLWFLEVLKPANNAYHIPILFRLKPQVVAASLVSAIRAVVERHEVLRTCIRSNSQGEGYQVVQDVSGFTPVEIEVRGRPELDQLVRSAVEKPFQLDREWPIRVSLCRIQRTGERYLSLVLHHIAFDGWSAGLLSQELGAFYGYFEGTGSLLEPLPIQYKDFALWQREELSTQFQSQLDFWKEKLSGFETLQLPTDKARPAQVDHSGAEVAFELDAALSAQLRAMARGLGVSLYTVLLSGFYLLLRGYTNQKDIVVGTPIANREHDQLRDLIGFFVNTLALRHVINPEQPVEEFVREVGRSVTEAQAHQDLPLEKLVAELKLPQDSSRHPLFQVMFGMQEFASDAISQLGDLLEPCADPAAYTPAKFDLTAMLSDSGEEISGVMNYATSLLEEGTIRSYISTYRQILRQVAAGRGKVKEVRYLNAADFHRVIYGWNETSRSFPAGKTIHQLFEEQAEKTPGSLAVAFGQKEITYGELNERANRLAHYLRANYEIKADDRIALLMERSEFVPMAMLAVLKAGAAYVPLDAKAPESRIRQLLEDSGAKVVLGTEATGAKAAACMKGSGTELDLVDSAYLEEALKSAPISNPVSGTNPEHLCYVIYTSGTTGRPKGVMVEHRNLVNFIWHKRTFLEGEDIVASCIQHSFDAINSELYPALLNGNKVVIAAEEERRDVDALFDFLVRHRITFLVLPAVVANELCERDLSATCIRILVTGGEVFNGGGKCSGIRCLNEYGPTEATVCATMHVAACGESSNNIGRPIPNVTAYVLDETGAPAPAGGIGELYLGGAGVARGYRGLPNLTRERFLANPFQSAADKALGRNSRLYRTGDLARCLPSGDLEFLGRNDAQIKICGYRIEPGEIEAQLAAFQGIQRVVVIAREQHLAAYYVADREIEISVLRSHLSERLPQYMVPGAFKRIDRIPLNRNGKLDRSALPEAQRANSAEHRSPKTPLQEELCAAYASVLDLEISEVGIDQNFFDLGGNSILAVKLAHRLQQSLGVEISAASVFRNPTVRALSSEVSAASRARQIVPRTLMDPREFRLSFAQERLWFLESIGEGTNAYHIPLLFRLKPGVSSESLRLALHAIVERHEVLRTFIQRTALGEPYQAVQDVGVFMTSTEEVSSRAELDQVLRAAVERPFHLDREFPIRALFCELEGREERYLCLVMHHIAFDGWSAGIFAREIGVFYNHFESCGEGALPEPLGIQYKDFALWQREQLNGEIESQLKYWKEKLSGLETLQLRTDKPRPARIDHAGADLSFQLDEELSAQLRAIARELGVSLYSLLLSAFYLLLRAYSNQNDIVIGTPVANRQHTELRDLIGFFVNTLALRQVINPEQPVREFVGEVGRMVMEAQAHQDLPLEKLVAELKLPQDSSRHPIFQVMFGVQEFASDAMSQLRDLLEPCADPAAYTPAKFDLTAMLSDGGSGISGVMNYATSLFEEGTIRSYIRTYREILRQIAAGTGKVKEVRYLNEGDFKRVICDWNETSRSFPAGKTVHQLFEEQVEKSPGSLALVFGEKEMTYGELNERANRLAHYLRTNHEIKADERIALLMERSEFVPVAMLAVLKAGAAYVPLDAKAPEERIRQLLEDSGAKVVLGTEATGAKVAACMEGIGTELILVDSAYLEDGLQSTPVSNPLSGTNPEHLCYVIYTSGTTGRPKGVMVEHRNLVNFIWHKRTFLEREDIVASCLQHSFDAINSELYPALLNGNKLVIAAEEERQDVDALFAFLVRQRITFLVLPAVIANELCERDLSQTCLRTLVTGGDVFTAAGKCRGIRWINEYGPTEATVCATMLVAASDESPNNIGRPISNVTGYILNEDLTPIPSGGIGELHIGGAGVARGYLNQPGLTAERFIANPFQSPEEKAAGVNSRLYKTGDLVHCSANGDLHFLGRNDAQMKVRGFRIEPGEIEARMIAFEGIAQATVIVREQPLSGAKSLIGYYVASRATDSARLRAHLEGSLPAHMVPAALIQIDRVPLTVNGKLDRQALPEPVWTDRTQYQAPRNSAEKEGCGVFAEVLGLNASDVGIDDDFFHLGGNSLLAVQAVRRLSQALGTEVRLPSLFSGRTVRSLCAEAGSRSLLHELNASEATRNMFMIHPGLAGCEVYHSLAQRLAPDFRCFGIDSHNLRHTEKIDNLNALATRYLAEIDRVQSKSGSDEYNLLGWSIGGQIALEVAALLEARGVRNIRVHLLDTVLSDARLRKALSRAPTDEQVRQAAQAFCGRIDELKPLLAVEAELACQPISRKLWHAEIRLFKAMQLNPAMERAVGRELEAYVRHKRFNNVEKCLESIRQIRATPLPDAHHWNILAQEKTIALEITRSRSGGDDSFELARLLPEPVAEVCLQFGSMLDRELDERVASMKP